MKNVHTVTVGALHTNCYILCGKTKCLVIDPGAQPEKLEGVIDSTGLKPEGILLTHCHYDHFGAADTIAKKYSVQIFAPEKDRPLLSDPNKNCSAMFGQSVTASADIFISESDTIPFEDGKISVLETPGHTRGSVCYLYREIMFSGDTLFFRSRGRTDLPGGSPLEMRNSFLKLMEITENYTVYPGHGATTTLASEKQHNELMVRLRNR